jgi:hypothetical protein
MRAPAAGGSSNLFQNAPKSLTPESRSLREVAGSRTVISEVSVYYVGVDFDVPPLRPHCAHCDLILPKKLVIPQD